MFALPIVWWCAQFLSQAWADSQVPLVEDIERHPSESVVSRAASRKLQGRFLHITDAHPDSHYKFHASRGADFVCHRGSGHAGFYGAEKTDCDAPFSLINETFTWIDKNLKDKIDFVIWTGDSARHDNDEHIPRTDKEVLDLNQYMVDKVFEVFGKPDNINDPDPTNHLVIPVIPTFGNNDMLPHNVLAAGPNKWTASYSKMWRSFIPEEQRHGFERGGWFFVEAIPNKLAVFSLNTMYFFDKNAAVDGCASKSEPGYEHMEWLRIQLQFIRQRGMKAILTGHVPPARTSGKANWDETCWQKYTLWLQQYRDIIVGSMYGHMNIDHFMLQDNDDISLQLMSRDVAAFDSVSRRDGGDGPIKLMSAHDYLDELRDAWADLPKPPKGLGKRGAVKGDGEEQTITISDDESGKANNVRKRKKKNRNHKKKSKKEKYYEKVGGKWAERYSVSMVTPSVIPNYFPTLRLISYNITGLEHILLGEAVNSQSAMKMAPSQSSVAQGDSESQNALRNDADLPKYWWSKDRRRGKEHPKKHKFPIPEAPSRSAPPGPAYSPQTLTLTGYSQYFANLTFINSEPRILESTSAALNYDVGRDTTRPSIKPKQFEYQIEYDTATDPIFNLTDLTVRSYLQLSQRIGASEKGNAKLAAHNAAFENGISARYIEKGAKHDTFKNDDLVWHTFVKRAFVGAVDDDDLRA